MNGLNFELRRYADREGCAVQWGNIVGTFLGQEFKEVFATETEAIERERQALANEAIGDDRKPIAIKRERMRG